MSKEVDKMEVEALELGMSVAPKPTTNNFRIGRDYGLQSTQVSNDLFAELVPKDEAIYSIGGLPQKVSQYDLEVYIYALEQLLYNQSVLSGSGKNVGVKRVKTKTLLQHGVEDYEGGTIIVTLTDLCKAAYGVKNPTTKQKEQMKSIIHCVDSNFVEVEYINVAKEDLKKVERDPRTKKIPEKLRKRLSVKLANIWFKEETLKERKGDINSPIKYGIQLNPIFCEMRLGYGLLPQNAMERLTDATKALKQRKTLAHVRLMKFLAYQNSNIVTKTADFLLREIGLWEAYKINKSRTIKALHNIFQALVKIGQLKGLPTQGTGANGVISYTFNIDPSFTKEISQEKTLNKAPEETPEK